VSTPLVVSGAVASLAMAGAGGWLVYTSATDRRLRQGARPPRRHGANRVRDLLRVAPLRIRPKSGIGPVSAGRVVPTEVLAAVIVVAVAGGILAWILFGGVLPALFAAGFAGTFPVAGYRRRQQSRLDSALEEWPRILEEIRLRTGSLGRSIPQSLFEAGGRAPDQWRPVFEAAEREWLLTVDFARTVAIIKEGLADATADAVCETLLMAHDIGGTDLDAKLADLIEDRTTDVQNRRDAASRLAGVRFARRFVLLVPLGMAVAGLTIGSGRQSYESPTGQLAVVAALASVAACWWWSGRLMRFPSAARVFR